MSNPRHFSFVFNSALELHLEPKTTIIPVSVRHENKSHKKTAPYSKERKQKRKRLKDRRGEEEDASGEDEEDSEIVTTGSWLEPRTVQTIMPSASHPPFWIPHRNIENSPAGSPSCYCHIGSARLPLWATAFIVHVALRHLLNIHYVIIF